VLLIWQLMLAVGFGALALFVATPLLAVIVVVVRVLYYEPARARQEWDRRERPLPAGARPRAREKPS
jgi:predicted PurR-regulated permease PerM